MKKAKAICDNFSIFLVYILLLSFCGGNSIYTTFTYSILGIVIVLVAVGFTANRIEKSLLETKFRTPLCPHNIRGGKSLNICNLCLQEQKEIERKATKEQEEVQRKANVRIQAEVLQKSEKLRLRNIQLQSEDNLLLFSPKEFEDEIAKLFRKLGYAVKQTSYSNDRGKCYRNKRRSKVRY